MYNFLTKIMFLLATIYSYFLFDLGPVFYIMVCLTLISIVSANFAGVFRGIWITVTIPINLIMLVLLVYAVFNLPPRLNYEERVTLDTTVVIVENGNKLANLLDDFYVNHSNKYLGKLQNLEADDVNILKAMEENKAAREELRNFINTNTFISIADTNWMSFTNFIRYELINVKHLLAKGEVSDGRIAFKNLLILFQNLSLNTFDREGVNNYFLALDELLDFYIVYHKELNEKEYFNRFATGLLDRALILHTRSIKVEAEKEKEKLRSYETLTIYPNSSKERVVDGLKIMWPIYDINLTIEELEDYYLRTLLIMNNNFFMANDDMKNHSYYESSLKYLQNPIGNYSLNSLQDSYYEDFYIRELTLSKLTVLKGLIDGNEKKITDRLSGSNYVVNEFADRKEIRSRYIWAEKNAFEFTYIK